MSTGRKKFGSAASRITVSERESLNRASARCELSRYRLFNPLQLFPCHSCADHVSREWWRLEKRASSTEKNRATDQQPKDGKPIGPVATLTPPGRVDEVAV